MRKLSPLFLLALSLPLAGLLAEDGDTPASTPIPTGTGAAAVAAARASPVPKGIDVAKKRTVDPNSPSRIAATYDKNGNGVLDDDEIVALRKDFAANPNGPLKQFDLNHDGILDDTEISKIPLPKIKPPKKKNTSTGGSLFGNKKSGGP